MNVPKGEDPKKPKTEKGHHQNHLPSQNVSSKRPTTSKGESDLLKTPMMLQSSHHLVQPVGSSPKRG